MYYFLKSNADDRVEEPHRNSAAGQPQYHTRDNVGKIVNPQIHPRKTDEQSEEQDRQYDIQRKPSVDCDSDHRERSRCVTRGERIEPRAVDYLLVVIKAVARTDALYKVLYKPLAHNVGKAERDNKVQAYGAPLAVDQKRQANKPPDYSDICGKRGKLHYSIQSRIVQLTYIGYDPSVNASDPIEHLNISTRLKRYIYLRI